MNVALLPQPCGFEGALLLGYALPPGGPDAVEQLDRCGLDLRFFPVEQKVEDDPVTLEGHANASRPQLCDGLLCLPGTTGNHSASPLVSGHAPFLYPGSGG